jgi:Flp pilus assembly protein TadB
VIGPGDRAEGLRALAGILRTGAGLRAALMEWHLYAPISLRNDLARLARRLSLGAPVGAAIESLRIAMGDDADGLAGLFAVHGRLGGDLPRMLEGFALRIEQRGAWFEAGRAAGSGALLSARIVAGLPLLLMLVAPMGRAPLFDTLGVALFVSGGSLAATGMWWMTRLVPKPQSFDDPAAALADTTASALNGGAPLAFALDVTAAHAPAPLSAPLRRARRMVRLGASWPEALGRLDVDALTSLARTLGRAESTGQPIAGFLTAWAEQRRSETAREFEAAMKRAPVLMVLPLTLCVLPSYGLIGLVPFLRGL